MSNAAVMVFIHGGGFLAGDGYYLYSGIPLASTGDVIVVILNYRLTAFGFLTTGGSGLNLLVQCLYSNSNIASMLKFLGLP